LPEKWNCGKIHHTATIRVLEGALGNNVLETQGETVDFAKYHGLGNDFILLIDFVGACMIQIFTLQKDSGTSNLELGTLLLGQRHRQYND
jgi:hypothetical protein